MRAWLRDAAGGLPGTYWFLWAGLLINRVGGFAVLFLSLYLTAQRGASPALAGLDRRHVRDNAEINSELDPLGMRGRYQAVFFLTFPAAAFLAPALGGASLQVFGRAHWLITAGVGLTAAALHLAAGPRRESRVATIRAQTTTDEACGTKRVSTGGGGRHPSP